MILMHRAAGELMRVVQTGFRTPAEYGSLGLDAAVRVSNCVNLADQLRLQYSVQQAAEAASAGDTISSGCSGPQVLEGQLLVCKVLLTGVLQEAEGHVQLVSRLGKTRQQVEYMQSHGALHAGHVPALIAAKRVLQPHGTNPTAWYGICACEWQLLEGCCRGCCHASCRW